MMIILSFYSMLEFSLSNSSSSGEELEAVSIEAEQSLELKHVRHELHLHARRGGRISHHRHNFQLQPLAQPLLGWSPTAGTVKCSGDELADLQLLDQHLFITVLMFKRRNWRRLGN